MNRDFKADLWKTAYSLELSGKDPVALLVCQKTYEYVVSTHWGARYENLFQLGLVSAARDIWVGVKLRDPSISPMWTSGDDALRWFAAKIKTIYVQEKNQSRRPQDFAWNYSNQTPLQSFNGATVGQVYQIYDHLNFAHRPYGEVIREDLWQPLPTVAELVGQKDAEDQASEESDSTEPLPNEVRIVHDDSTNRLRAQGNDGVHGTHWVRFPDELRVEGAVYEVGSLEYQARGYYTVRGYIKPKRITEGLEKPSITDVVAQAYQNFQDKQGRAPSIEELMDDLVDNWEGFEEIKSTSYSTRRWAAYITDLLDKRGYELAMEAELRESLLREAEELRSPYDIEFEFVYPGEKEPEVFFFDLPYSLVIEALRRWSSHRGVELDGTDLNIQRLCSEIATVFNKEDQRLNDLLYEAVEDQQEWLKEQCKAEAWEAFVEDWQERHEEDESLNETAHGHTTYRYAGNRYEPPEWEGHVCSDISGKKITDEDDTWITADGEVGTRAEVWESFVEIETLKLQPDTEEYEKAKQYMKDTYDYKDEDFEDAQLVKLPDDTYEDLSSLDSWDKGDLMGKFGYHQISWDSDHIEWDPDERDYGRDDD